MTPTPSADGAPGVIGRGPTAVAVVGGSRPDSGELTAARGVGAALARRDAVLVCGGLGGVMEAACEGAAAEGGTTIGLLPGLDRAAANPHVQIPLPTGLGDARNLLVVRAGAAVIAVGGAYGTLSEIALALNDGTPVVGLGTWELHRAGRLDPGIRVADDPEQAVEMALDLAREWPQA